MSSRSFGGSWSAAGAWSNSTPAGTRDDVPSESRAEGGWNMAVPFWPSWNALEGLLEIPVRGSSSQAIPRGRALTRPLRVSEGDLEASAIANLAAVQAIAKACRDGGCLADSGRDRRGQGVLALVTADTA